MQKQEPNLEQLRSALADSTAVNRTNLFTFVIFEVYMLITLAGTTDFQLLVPGSSVQLPIVNLGIPLFGFYLLAPVFILAVHFNLLFHLRQHIQKLSFWADHSSPAQKKTQTPAFLVNYLATYSPGQINYHLLRIVLYFLVFFLPLALLVYTQVIFSKYHSRLMTLWHFSAVLLDMFLLLLYWPRIINQDSDVLQSESLGYLAQQGKMLITLRWKGLKKEMAVLLGFVLIVIIGIGLMILSATIFGLGAFVIPIPLILIYSFVSLICFITHTIKFWPHMAQYGFIKNLRNMLINALLLLPLIRKFIRSISRKKNLVDEKAAQIQDIDKRKSEGKMEALFFFAILLLALSNFTILEILPLFFKNGIPPKLLLKVYPSLNLKEQVLVGKKPPPEIITHYLGKNEDIEYAWVQFSEGLDLRKRDLRGANLSFTRLYNADLRNSKLHGAKLFKAKLNNTNLSGAVLNGADFGQAVLNDANLSSSNLYKTDFTAADLQRTDFTAVQEFETAIFTNSRMMGANFSETYMGEVRFYNTDLSAADFKKASLYRAVFDGCNLENAVLDSAVGRGEGIYQHLVVSMIGANLIGSSLKNAKLSNAKLQGADLSGAYVYGSDLYGAQLQGADLSLAKMDGVNLSYARLEGANLSGAQLYAVELKQANLCAADLSKAQIQAVDLSEANLQGVDFTKATIKNIAVEKSNWHSTKFDNTIIERVSGTPDLTKFIPWKKIQKDLFDTNMIVSNPKRIITRIQKASVNTKDFDPKKIDRQFKRAEKVSRKAIALAKIPFACKDKAVAKGIKQNIPWMLGFNNSDSDSVEHELYKYLQANCPEYLTGYWFY